MADQTEHDVLRHFGIEEGVIEKVGSLRVKGTRRALRFAIPDAELSAGGDERGEYLELQFTAPTGSYATVVLGEIMKCS